jgi:hypothetical protein
MAPCLINLNLIYIDKSHFIALGFGASGILVPVII